MDTMHEIDWPGWLRRWDDQQTGYLPLREARFAAMLDVLEVLLPPTMVVLDLACGPGSLSQRVLARFPQARCIALDWDPVLLRLGKEALGTQNGRLHWVEADLRTPAWPAAIGATQVDAVVSTTALHWLPLEQLVRTYNHLGALVREGGVVLNGDNMRFAPNLPTFQQLADTVNTRIEADAFETRGVETWERWWSSLGAEPGLAAVLTKRHQRFLDLPTEPQPTFDIHGAALRDAGFREVGTIWQSFDDRILMAIR